MLADPQPRARVRRAEASEQPAGAAADAPAASVGSADALPADGGGPAEDEAPAAGSAAGGDDSEAAGGAGELGAAALAGDERELDDGDEGDGSPPAKLARASNDADVGAAVAAAAASAAGASPAVGRKDPAAVSPAGASASAASPAAASPTAAAAAAAASKAEVELAMAVEREELSVAAKEYSMLKGQSSGVLDGVVGVTAGWDLAQLERARHALAAAADEFADAHRAYMAARLSQMREGGGDADGDGGDGNNDGGGAGARPRPRRPTREALLDTIRDMVVQWRE
jgi:hypothetical protein